MQPGRGPSGERVDDTYISIYLSRSLSLSLSPYIYIYMHYIRMSGMVWCVMQCNYIWYVWRWVGKQEGKPSETVLESAAQIFQENPWGAWTYSMGHIPWSILFMLENIDPSREGLRSRALSHLAVPCLAWWPGPASHMRGSEWEHVSVWREQRGSQGMGAVSDSWFDGVLLSILYIFKASCWPMFKPPSLDPPLFPLTSGSSLA